MKEKFIISFFIFIVVHWILQVLIISGVFIHSRITNNNLNYYFHLYADKLDNISLGLRIGIESYMYSTFLAFGFGIILLIGLMAGGISREN